jgi:hypothetical protein
MIDTATSFLAAATFTNANGFWFNGVVSESTNLRDWISNTLQYFLLRQARIGGKEALKPLVPTNNDGTIKTTAVSWVFTFTEQHIIPDSPEITYTPLADRKPFCATVLWRQQDDLGIPVMRTAEVRYTGTAVDGPFEQHDLSGFCASENHAVKVGTYIISKRRHVTHRLKLGVKPDAFNPTLAAGDLVRVRLERIASTGADSLHDYLYEVDRIGKSISGEISLDLTHFPVDANLASVVAQEVNAATGSGLLLPTGLSGVTCDVNSSSNTSVPAETFTSGTFPDYGSSFDAIATSDLGDPPVNNPEDGLDAMEDVDLAHTTSPAGEVPRAGVGLDPGASLCGGDPSTIEWYADGVLISTLTFPGGGSNPIVTYQSPSIEVPSWLGGLREGVLLIQVGKEGVVYTSRVTCPDGRTQSGQTVVQAGLLSRDYSVSWSGTGTVAPPVTSIGRPGYSTIEAAPRWRIYVYNGTNYAIASSSVSAPGLTNVENTPI